MLGPDHIRSELDFVDLGIGYTEAELERLAREAEALLALTLVAQVEQS